jgi:hypothetical protein
VNVLAISHFDLEGVEVHFPILDIFYMHGESHFDLEGVEVHFPILDIFYMHGENYDGIGNYSRINGDRFIFLYSIFLYAWRKLRWPILIGNYSRIHGDSSNCSSRLMAGQSC